MAFKQTALAKALGIDPSVVTRNKALGMPVDSVDAARSWRAQHVRLRMPAAGASTLDATDLVRAAENMMVLAGQALESGNEVGFDALVPALQAALRAVPPSARDVVLIHAAVFDRLLEPLLSAAHEIEAEEAAAGIVSPPRTDAENATMGRFFYGLAAGEKVELPD